ncbi:MAG TPA: alpha/beta fold hydrolase [Anaeromyxobacteraceae bacterium]|nr:alpha/beta fold hydrolase [Anaeromyxobacteraceae bacterium]
MLLVHRVVPPRAPGERPPLVVLLHGIGADEEDLLPLATHFDPRFLVISARAQDEADPMGYRWYAIDWTATPPRGDPEEIAASRDLLASFVEQATAAYGADPARVFLFGFSQGSIMSLALLLARPDLVRGVVAHSGRLSRLPGPDPVPEALSNAEVLILHGEQDEVVPAAQGRKAYEVLAPLLGARVAYRAFEGLGHGISEESLAEAARWLKTRLDTGRLTESGRGRRPGPRP